MTINADTFVQHIREAINRQRELYCEEEGISLQTYLEAVDITGDNLPFNEQHVIGGETIIKAESVEAGSHAVDLYLDDEPFVVDTEE